MTPNKIKPKFTSLQRMNEEKRPEPLKKKLNVALIKKVIK
jgi:hypothetical protein